MKTFALALMVALAGARPAGAASASASFSGLGDLPGGDFESRATAVSADGSVVVGQGHSAAGPEAFRWRGRWRGGAMRGLGDLPGGGFESEAAGVSADGSVVVGWGSSDSGYEAFRWEGRVIRGVMRGVMGGLGDLRGGGFESGAFAVSADGSVVVGRGWSARGRFEAFRWEGRVTRGMVRGVMRGLGDLPGGDFRSVALGVSADGSVVVGWGSSDAGYEAFRWEDGVMTGLGDLPGGDFDSLASGVSADGAVVVGVGSSDAGFEAFRWEGGVMTGLGDLPGGEFDSLAYGVSADGSVVVGRGSSDAGQEAFIWDGARGMRNLQEVLVKDYGLGAALAGWTLKSAKAISADGTSIVGYGINPAGQTEAWRAVIPAPAPDRAADRRPHGARRLGPDLVASAVR